jgi:cytidylate kinase
MPSDVIAIDGPAASGKSTVARRVAAELGYLYVDSGAVYRAVAWKVLAEAVNAGDPVAVEALMRRVTIAFEVVGGAAHVRINGCDPGAALRSERVGEGVSEVAAVPAVRDRVTAALRGLRGLGGLVMEGRDIGTVVFPDARHKVYLDASAEERTRRRHAELQGGADMQAVRASLERRDGKDSGRPTAPLRVAPDAVVIDTTSLTIDRVVARIIARVRGQPAALCA